MTGAMPRPSTRLSSRESTPKRRRAPPPLSVTNVFADTRVPDSADKLWKWPVTSWYFGDVGNADLHITSDRPFINDVTSLPPIEKHYRLRWLEEDANKFVNGEQPTPPEPLPLIPYARQKDTFACARPARGLGTGVERPAPGRPRKRRCIPTEAPVVEPATINGACESADTDTASNPNAPKTLLQGSDASAEIPSPTRVASMANVVKPEPMSIDVKPRQVSYRQPKIPPASNFCTPPLSVQEALTAPSPCETLPCELPLENESTPSESPESTQPTNVEAKPLATGDEKASQDDAHKAEDDIHDEDSRDAVALQFASPLEPRLMGTLTYSFPVDAAPEKDDKQVSVVDMAPEVKQNSFAEEGICLEGMDLEFRKSNRQFEDVFEDRDVADELRPEILRFNNLLNGLGPKTKPLRNMIHAVIQKEMNRHNEALEAQAEEGRIIARLKEIEKEKAAVKAKEKAAQAKAKAAARRASARLGTPGQSRRRVSRKIVDEPQSDHDSDDDDDDVKNIAETVVPLDDDNPIVDGKVIDNRKLLLNPEYKAELEELTSVILNAPQAGMVADATQNDDIKAQADLVEEKPAAPVDAILSASNKKESNESKAEDVPTSSPLAAEDVSNMTLGKEEPKANTVPVVNDKDSVLVDFPVVDAPAVASTATIGESVDQAEASPVKERYPADVEMTNRNADEAMRHVLAELTNIPSKFQPQDAQKEQKNGSAGTVCEEQELNSIWYDVTDNPGNFQNERLPLGQELEREAEVTTTPITEIDMDAALDSDDEAKPKEKRVRGGGELQVDLKAPCEYDSDSQFILQPVQGNAPCTVFVKDGKIDEQLVRMPSPVSPLQAATPSCGFVIVPTSSRTKLLTSGSALVNHMKAIHGEAKKKTPSESDS